MITQQEYLRHQPETTSFTASDQWYLDFANKLLDEWNASDILKEVNEYSRKEIILVITGYYLDIAGDIGLWRTFIGYCRRLYGFPVPFYTDAMQDEIDADGKETCDYIDYELNLADVRFLVWYGISFSAVGNGKFFYPFDKRLLQLASLLHKLLEENYDSSPHPEGLTSASTLDFYDPEDTKAIGGLARWLFWCSYLLVPAFRSNLYALMESLKGKNDEIQTEELEEAENSAPTGPLALYLREWLWLMIKGEMPKERKNNETQEHPWYKPFLEANGSSNIAFFNNYREMNRFLAKAFGWDGEADNLPALKDARNFTLLINPRKGMLIARDVAECIDAPGNRFYDAQFAALHSFDLITQRGRCPIDLITYSLAHSMLPELQWPGEGEISKTTTQTNADFIARCYLLQYYRAL